MASFFISYSEVDEDWARRIDAILETLGHSSIAMFKDFPAGTKWHDLIDREIGNCQGLIAILSEASVGSQWVRDEIHAYQGVAASSESILPILIEECALPPTLQTIQGLKLFEVALKDIDDQIRQAIEGLLISKEPQGSGDASAWPEIISPGVSTDRNVIGRTEEIAQIRATLTAGKDVAILPGAQRGMVVKGQGGMGKTTLARHYIECHSQEYRGIWWLRAQSRVELIEDFCKLAIALKLAPLGTPQSEDLAMAAVQALQTDPGPWLLVYDNAETIVQMRDLIPVIGDVHLLLTSREGGWPDRFNVLGTERLEPEMATNLLMQESARDADRDGAKALAAVLDGFPLALVQAGRWLRDVPSASFADYADRHEALLGTKPATIQDYPDSIYGAMKLSLDKLPDDAALLMKVFAWLSPEDLWPGLVTALASEAPEHEFNEPVPAALWMLANDDTRVQQAFAALERASLINATGNSFTMHRLTQQAQRAVLNGASGFAEAATPFDDERHSRESGNLSTAGDPRLRGDDVDNWPAIAATMLAAGYPSSTDPQRPESWPICTRLNPHVAVLDQLDDHTPRTAAMDYLFNQTSLYFRAHRLDETSLHYAERSLDICETRRPEDHRELATRWTNLGIEYGNAGRLEEAEESSAKAVAIAEQNVEIADVDRATFLSNHGRRLKDLAVKAQADDRQSLFRRAQKRYQAALKLGLNAHRRISREVGVRVNNLANLHNAAGRPGAALRFYRLALAIDRQALPQGDPDIASDSTNLGSVLLEQAIPAETLGHAARDADAVTQAQADIRQARDLFVKALDILHNAFFGVNPRHPDVLNTAHWLIRTHLALDDRAAAEQVAEPYDLDVDRHADWIEAQRQKGLDAGQGDAE